MEHRKVKVGLRGRTIVGIVFVMMGGIYAVLGGTFVTARAWGLRLGGAAFLGVGLLFLIPGIIFLVLESRWKRRVKAVIAAGRYVWGEVIDIESTNVRVNGRSMRNVIVCYTDMYGTKHIFKGPNQRIYRDPGLLGKKVKVYIEDESCKVYYVDTAGLMDHIVEH